MSFSKASDVPDSIPEKYKPQFMEVWNSVYAASTKAGKSDAQAQQDAYAEAHGVVNKGREKDDREGQPGADLSAQPGATPSPRFAEDQPRDPDGKFASGNQSDPHEHEAVKQAAGHEADNRIPIRIGRHTYYAKYSDAESKLPNAMPTYHAETKSGTYFMHLTQNDVDKYHAKFKAMSRDLSQQTEKVETFMNKTIEIRYVKELRVGESQGDEMALVGYAARFNSQSKDLGGFFETIAPGAFTRAIAEKQDVRCLFNHNSNMVLGRTASGTLSLAQDDKGLAFRCQLDQNQQSHRDLHSAVKRGDINECSFAFTPNGDKGDEWQDKQDERGNWFIARTLKDLNLFDVSAVTHPAYDDTSVAARAEANVTAEIRGILSKLVEKRAKRVEHRDESVEQMLSKLNKALSAKFPCQTVTEACSPGWGMYYITDTFDDYVIACNNYGPGANEYVKIPYVVSPDGDGYVFGTPTPVEKEWVASDRAAKTFEELRTMKAAHMQAIANAHKDQSAQHEAVADAHTGAADAHQAEADAHANAADAAQSEADKMKRCEDMRGDCDVKSCRCQNQMVAARDVDDDYDDDWNDDWDDDDKKHNDGDRAAHKMAVETRHVARKLAREKRDDSQVRTKTVDGKHLSASAFAFVGDPSDTSTWKYPVMDADHARNALARWGQHKGIPADKEAGVYARICSAAKKFGIEVSETDATKATRSVTDRVAKELRAKTPMTAEEITDWKNKFRLQELSAELA